MAKRKQSVVVYPGTFDPLTNGHISLIRRGLGVFDKLILAVAKSTHKTPLFSIDERLDMAREALKNEPRVVVEPFDGLLVDYVQERGARIILRGMRAVSDFEFEFQLALMNRRLNRNVQTVFMITDYKWLYISSTIIKEAAHNGGDIRGLVPDNVLEALRVKYNLPSLPLNGNGKKGAKSEKDSSSDVE